MPNDFNSEFSDNAAPTKSNQENDHTQERTIFTVNSSNSLNLNNEEESTERIGIRNPRNRFLRLLRPGVRYQRLGNHNMDDMKFEMEMEGLDEADASSFPNDLYFL